MHHPAQKTQPKARAGSHRLWPPRPKGRCKLQGPTWPRSSEEPRSTGPGPRRPSPAAGPGLPSFLHWGRAAEPPEPSCSAWARESPKQQAAGFPKALGDSGEMV